MKFALVQKLVEVGIPQLFLLVKIHLLGGDVATSQAAYVVLGTEIHKLPRQGDQKGWLRHTRTPQRTFAFGQM